MDPKLAMDIALLALLGGIIGARLLHVLYEQPDYYLKSPIDVFKLWQGGFVFYGGALVGFILPWIYVRKLKQPVKPWMDEVALVVSASYGVGRLACFFAGCCYGEYCSFPWAVYFPEGVEAPAHTPLHPTQLYDFILSLLVCGFLFWVSKNRNKLPFAFKQPGGIFYLWMALHGLIRLIVEQFRNDFRGDLIVGFSISSWVSFGIIFAGMVLLLNNRKNT